MPVEGEVGRIGLHLAGEVHALVHGHEDDAAFAVYLLAARRKPDLQAQRVGLA